MDQIDNYIQSFLNGSLDAEGHAALRQWVKADPENKEYFHNTVAVWKATGILSNADGFDVEVHEYPIVSGKVMVTLPGTSAIVLRYEKA